MFNAAFTCNLAAVSEVVGMKKRAAVEGATERPQGHRVASSK